MFDEYFDFFESFAGGIFSESFPYLIIGFFFAAIAIAVLLGLAQSLGAYVIVEEKQALVYTLFGNVVGVISDPGLHFLWIKFGPRALLLNSIGRRYKVDLRLDQEYLRSQPVNSEEGAPMGVGVWYEMYISDPVNYIFQNSDPRGSLAANVGSSTVRSLSNLPLEKMMDDRHAMSRMVREEVSGKSSEWGYLLGSCYIRKVHFRDNEMIRQIESKVVNRLRQVTSAIKQDGANQVSVIRSTAEKKAAIDFGKASAVRPKIVGDALRKISTDKEVADATFDVLETERIVDRRISMEWIPENADLLAQFAVSSRARAVSSQEIAKQQEATGNR